MADLTENAILLYFSGEPAQQAFEAFIASGDHIRHATPPPFEIRFSTDNLLL
jgi:hypothetical protein